MKKNQPHDKLFKITLKEKAIAIDFIQNAVPATTLKRLDLSRLRLTDKSLILPGLQEIHADIIYECPINEREGYVFFLLEHNSTSKGMALMPFWKLQYTIALMADHLAQNHKQLPIERRITIYYAKY